jgi:hypothetical protein
VESTVFLGILLIVMSIVMAVTTLVVILFANKGPRYKRTRT